jgi:small GTP-binding protein
MAEHAKISKIVLLGEISVGKTCIINRFVNNSFDLKELSSSSASFITKIVKFDDMDEEIKFEIWDTVGQEKYRALTKIFYKDAGVAVLVYDITRRESFEEIKKYWHNQIKEYAPKNISKKKYIFNNLINNI